MKQSKGFNRRTETRTQENHKHPLKTHHENTPI